MPKTSKVRLGGREYVLTEKVLGVGMVWRKALRESSVMRLFESLDGALNQIVQAVNALGEDAGNGRINFTAGINFATVLPAVVAGLTNSMDDVIALLFDYAPELKADEEYLLAHAYNEEVIVAFVEVLKLVYPITALWDMVRGSKAPAIATNLPSMNGVGHGTKKNTARQKSR